MIINLGNEGFSVNGTGNLALRGVDLVEVGDLSAKRPVYVLDEAQLKSNIGKFKDALKKYYPAPSLICFASKALLNLWVCSIMEEEGIGMDLCSEGEMFVAESANFPFSRVIIHGNSKSRLELKKAISLGAKHIIVDNMPEFHLISEICLESNAKCSVLVRINPAIEVTTHQYMATGVKDSKFGLMWSDETLSFIKQIEADQNVEFAGLHYHIGSQITDPTEIIKGAELIVESMSILKKHNIACRVLDIGGGIGIKYLPNDPEVDIDSFMKDVLLSLVKELKAKGLDLPEVLIEPGRAIAGNAGCTVYKVETIKPMDDGDGFFVAVNGGMTDNIRTALYQAKYFAMRANKAKETSPAFKYKVVGRCCETGDLLIHEIMLPKLAIGDVLVIFCTGAYNASLASNFNKHPIPGMILVKDASYEWIVKEQPVEDMIRYDVHIELQINPTSSLQRSPIRIGVAPCS